MNKLIVENIGELIPPKIHPILLLLREGKKITSWKVTGEFEDDHLPCLTITVKFGKKSYKVDDCWLSYRGVADRIAAEKDKTVREKILKYWEQMAKREERDYAAYMKEEQALEVKAKKR